MKRPSPLPLVVLFSVISIAMAGCADEMAGGPGEGIAQENQSDGSLPIGDAPPEPPPSSETAPTSNDDGDPCRGVRSVRIKAGDVFCRAEEVCTGSVIPNGGSGSYRWKDGEPPLLPEGLEWSDGGFSFTGKPTSNGSFQIEAEVEDAACDGKGRGISFTITVWEPIRVVEALKRTTTVQSARSAPPLGLSSPGLSLAQASEVTRDSVGGKGGQEFESKCPEDQVVSRIDIRSNQKIQSNASLYQIQIFCSVHNGVFSGIDLRCAALNRDGSTDLNHVWTTGRCGSQDVERNVTVSLGYGVTQIVYSADDRLGLYSIMPISEPIPLWEDALWDIWDDDGQQGGVKIMTWIGGDGGRTQLPLGCAPHQVMKEITFAAGKYVDDIIDITCTNVKEGP